MKVLMLPTLAKFGSESGIKRVIEAYTKYLVRYGVEFVGTDDECDIVSVHAGTASVAPDIAHCHGLYWTDDYMDSDSFEWRANQHVIHSVRHAHLITVPSDWVAETFRRDMRMNPFVLPHGIEWEEWDASGNIGNYVLWNKNRFHDVCNPRPVTELAKRFPKVKFITTFADKFAPRNVTSTGLLPHDQMKLAVEGCGVYLATTKETFGIGILEAMAAGRPVLGFAHGGIVDLVEHGVNGYLAEPNDYEDLADGLVYCIDNADILGANSREMVKEHGWEPVADKLYSIYQTAYKMVMLSGAPSVDVVIPVYNKTAQELDRALTSAVRQTKYLGDIFVVDDGSDEELAREYKSVVGDRATLVRKPNGGVATARNLGISLGRSKYVLCLDSDDWIMPEFLEACVPALEEDRSLGIAYTGLWATKPDGDEGLSPWPGEFNYDNQLRKQNQIPTACVFRREMWRRLGGYKQRYAPGGAGAEDAEFWLRAGSIGYGAKKVTSAGLFRYSWESGIVSGDKSYVEPDWLQWHPWTGDGKHPFASVATPSAGNKKFSHPVRQYDEPVVSVIIPVGPGHDRVLEDALDSLESQTFRKWEVIVVNDTGEKELGILDAYPYVRYIDTGGGAGAGASRNMGAEKARAKMFLFLDADDYLMPSAIEDMLSAWGETNKCVYSDYYGIAMIADPDSLSPKLRDNIVDKLPSGELVIEYKPKEYDCLRAMDEPGNPPYIWCNITTLVPRAWHREIGGFDESMPSWEDVDYWWRLAWSGKCFHKVEKPLMVYKFYTGSRRETGIKEWDGLLEYMQKKKEGIVTMGCGCKGTKTAPLANTAPKTVMEATMVSQDSQFILVKYLSPNKGQHAVRGQSTRTFYGYRGGGETFLVHVDDVRVQPHLFMEIQQVVAPAEERAPLPKPREVTFEKSEPSSGLPDYQNLPGVTPQIAERMEASRVTLDDLRNMSVDDMVGAFKGVGPAKAQVIYDYLHE